MRHCFFRLFAAAPAPTILGFIMAADLVSPLRTGGGPAADHRRAGMA